MILSRAQQAICRYRASTSAYVPPARLCVRTCSMFAGPGAEKLRAKSCEGACSRDTPLVPAEELPELLKAVPAWSLNPERTMLTRKFTARNFMAAMAFFNKLAEVAESQGHHPDFHLRNYREVEVNIQTHVAGGITMNDFVLAAQLDQLDVEYSPKWLQSQQVPVQQAAAKQ